MITDNHPHTSACIICREDKPMYTKHYGFSVRQQLGLCEDCAKLVLADFKKEFSEKRIKSVCFFHFGGSNEPCEHTVYFAYKPAYPFIREVGVCLCHAQKALEYFEESRNPEDSEDYGDFKPLKPKPKKEPKKDNSQLSLF